MSAFFPAGGVFLGERGISARQLAVYLNRLDAAIQAGPPSARGAWARRELDGLERQSLAASADPTPVSSRARLRAAWRGEVAASDAVNQRMTSNGLGEIDALTNPFEARRDGWRLEKGAAVTFMPTVALTASRFAAAIQPRFSSFVSEGRKERVWQGTLHRLYARAVVRNFAIRVGAEETLWGQSPIGSLFISGNAPPLPAIVIATDTGITMPGWFRAAGPVRATLMLADLGGRQDPPHAKLAGWQLSVMPWRRFELGVSVLTQTGGSGGPKASFFERVIDLFPVIDALAPQRADLLISNKVAGGNLRLRLPELSGLDLYYELQIDDFDGRRLRSSMVDDAAHLLGARLPVVTSRGLLAFRGEWHHTGIRLYEHTQFRSGLTYKRHVIGSPLGPHAAAGYFAITWQPSQRTTVELLLADERRDPAMYTATFAQPRERGFTFVRLTDDPDVRRARSLVAFNRALPAGVLNVVLGHNVSWRTGQPKRGEWLGRITLGSRYLPVF